MVAADSTPPASANPQLDPQFWEAGIRGCALRWLDRLSTDGLLGAIALSVWVFSVDESDDAPELELPPDDLDTLPQAACMHSMLSEQTALIAEQAALE